MEQGSGRDSAAKWSWNPWRLLPPVLLLLVVALIWATRADVMLANHWAYPLLVSVVGLISLGLVVSARPRWTDA